MDFVSFQIVDIISDDIPDDQNNKSFLVTIYGIDENNNQLSCISFERIKGGKPFDITTPWFQQTPEPTSAEDLKPPLFGPCYRQGPPHVAPPQFQAVVFQTEQPA